MRSGPKLPVPVVKFGTVIGMNCVTPSCLNVASIFSAFAFADALVISSNESWMMPTFRLLMLKPAFQLNGTSVTLMSRPSGLLIACMTIAVSSA